MIQKNGWDILKANYGNLFYGVEFFFHCQNSVMLEALKLLSLNFKRKIENYKMMRES